MIFASYAYRLSVQMGHSLKGVRACLVDAGGAWPGRILGLSGRIAG